MANVSVSLKGFVLFCFFVCFLLQGPEVCLALLCPGLCVSQDWGRGGCVYCGMTPVPCSLGSGPSQAFQQAPSPGPGCRVPTGAAPGRGLLPWRPMFCSRKLGLWATNRSTGLGTRARRGSESEGVQGPPGAGLAPGGGVGAVGDLT